MNFYSCVNFHRAPVTMAKPLCSFRFHFSIQPCDLQVNPKTKQTKKNTPKLKETMMMGEGERKESFEEHFQSGRVCRKMQRPETSEEGASSKDVNDRL